MARIAAPEQLYNVRSIQSLVNLRSARYNKRKSSSSAAAATTTATAATAAEIATATEHSALLQLLGSVGGNGGCNSGTSLVQFQSHPNVRDGNNNVNAQLCADRRRFRFRCYVFRVSVCVCVYVYGCVCVNAS